jgi:deoxyribodipyrimidine photo-lyase
MNTLDTVNKYDRSLVWFRRDLRSFDHAALFHALKTSSDVHCVFVFDTRILSGLPEDDRRVAFIWDSVVELRDELLAMGGALIVRHGCAIDEVAHLAQEMKIDAVFINHDYEPEAMERDVLVSKRLGDLGCSLVSFKDQTIFEKNEVLTQSKTPFSVFSPYKRAWLEALHLGDGFFTTSYPVQTYASKLASAVETASLLNQDVELAMAVPTMDQLGFSAEAFKQTGLVAGMTGGQALLDGFADRMGAYDETRDFPALAGTSGLSVHLRFGTVSIRSLAKRALEGGGAGSSKGRATWLSELIWRDFYFMILYHNPRVTTRAFKADYDAIVWETGASALVIFESWCQGRTGYPLVDAAMRQLNQTGFMHNRLRMVVASFLTKDLGLDWRWGEKYFAGQLLDYDLSANNGGWQWASSSGCDAQPYFRIFNPVAQSEKFDPDCAFIKQYVRELALLPARFCHAPWLASDEVLIYAGVNLGVSYPKPIVDHAVARRETLARYSVVKKVAI